MARRVCSKSLYLPVPTSSRAPYDRPSTISGSLVAAPVTSAAPDGLDDLDPVAALDGMRFELAAGDDPLVDLDRDAALELEPAQQVGDGAYAGQGGGFAV